MKTREEQTSIIQDVTQAPAPTSNEVVAEANAAMSGVFPVRIDRMLESLRYAEYDINGGVGELADNSIEEGAQNIWVAVTAEPKKFKNKTIEVVGEIAVADDGGGMAADVLGKCLVLGETLRPKKAGGSKGIGRFGVGMTLGAISLGRRVEVYSRQKAADPFLFTYLDLDEVGARKQTSIPKPAPAELPKAYADLLKESSGTVVIIRNCDRLQTDPVEREKGIAASEQVKGLPVFLGRTYRKFIYAGRKLWLNGLPVYLHDPLYELGPTYFDAKGGKPEPKAKEWGTSAIELEVPGNPKETAKVTIRMTLLPKEWRPEQGAGNWTATKERHIDDNEGISILRADREVLYGPVPYIIGRKGRAKFLEIDRWWGCEIAFPPELDEYFHVRYIKRGAEPVGSLREKIREEIYKAVDALRNQIQADYQKTKDAKEKEQGIYAEAEDAMAKANAKLPKGKRGTEQTPEESDKQLEELVRDDVSTTDPTEKEKKKAELKHKPFSIVPVNYPKNVFFETQHGLGRITVKLNVNHPFYKEVFEPLCGTVETMTEDSDLNDGADTPTKQLARRGFLLLLLSYGKSESFFTDQEDLLENLRSHWGITLAAVMKA